MKKEKPSQEELDMRIERDLGLKDWRWDKTGSIRFNLEELRTALRRTWDRAWNGVDRWALWNADDFYMAHMYDVLTWYRFHRNGSPQVKCPLDKKDEKGGELYCGCPYQPKFCEECQNDCHALWNKELEKVCGWIREWLESERYVDIMKHEPKLSDLENKIFNWLNLHWRSLWD